jgi:4-hydroxybenzoate polyprenyltransferase
MPALIQVIHPAPALAVTLLSAVLGAILLGQVNQPLDARWLLTVASVAGSQVFTGATNDLVDRDRDAASRRSDKPLAAGRLSPNAAAWIASAGLAVQLAASLRLGPLPLLLGAVAVGSAAVYNLVLSRTPLSPLPYLVSFAVLPLWIATGTGVEPQRVAAAVLLAPPFAAAAHLANTVRDFEADAAGGSRSLAQVLGRRRAHLVALGLSLATGLGVTVVLLVAGRASAPAWALGAIGLVAIGQGAASARRLWAGMLVAAVCWTAAWALSSA